MSQNDRIVEVNIDNIIVDPRYQRPLNEPHVRRLLANWDDKACQTVTLARRTWTKERQLAMMDGQHRYEAKRRRGDTKIRAEVIDVLSVGEEADLFAKFNGGRAAVTHRDILSARMTAGEKQAEEIREILDKTGFRIGSGQALYLISATKALQTSIERFGPDVLENSLRVIAAIWRGTSSSTRHQMIEGFGLFLAACHQHIEQNVLIKKLGTTIPEEIIQKSKRFNLRNSSTATDVARVLGTYYNSHRTNDNRIEFDALIEKWQSKISTKELAAANAANRTKFRKTTISPTEVAIKKNAKEKSLHIVQKIPTQQKQLTSVKNTIAEGFENRDEAGWKTAVRIKDAIEEIRGNTGSVETIAKKIYEMENLPFPTKDGARLAEMEKVIRRVVASQGNNIGIKITGNMVGLE